MHLKLAVKGYGGRAPARGSPLHPLLSLVAMAMQFRSSLYNLDQVFRLDKRTNGSAALWFSQQIAQLNLGKQEMPANQGDR